jgi:hypothetical protein
LAESGVGGVQRRDRREVITVTDYHSKWWNIVAFGANMGFVIVVASLSITKLPRPTDTHPVSVGA